MKASPDTHKIHLDTLYGTNIFTVALFEETVSNYIFTVRSDNYSFASNHNFIDGSRVRVSVSSNGSLPGNLLANTNYYIVQSSTSVFSLSSTRNGNAINVSNNGTGIFTVTEQPLDITIDSGLANWVRHEVNYYGASRQSLIFGNCKTGIQNSINMAFTEPIPIIFQPQSASIVARYVGIIRNGDTTAKDATGILDLIEDYQSSFTIPQNSPKGFAFILRKYSL